MMGLQQVRKRYKIYHKHNPGQQWATNAVQDILVWFYRVHLFLSQVISLPRPHLLTLTDTYCSSAISNWSQFLPSHPWLIIKHCLFYLFILQIDIYRQIELHRQIYRKNKSYLSSYLLIFQEDKSIKADLSREIVQTDRQTQIPSFKLVSHGLKNKAKVLQGRLQILKWQVLL